MSCCPRPQEYENHEPSRESIELAFDSILQQKFKLRNKYGFRPPSLGRKTDLEADEEVGTNRLVCSGSVLRNQCCCGAGCMLCTQSAHLGTYDCQRARKKGDVVLEAAWSWRVQARLERHMVWSTMCAVSQPATAHPGGDCTPGYLQRWR